MVPVPATATVPKTEQEVNPRTSKPEPVQARIAPGHLPPGSQEEVARNHLRPLRGRKFQGASWLGARVNATGAMIPRGTVIGAPTDG